jgi:hypothetical protein
MIQRIPEFDSEAADPDQPAMCVIGHQIHDDVNVAERTRLAPSDGAEQPRVRCPVLGEEGPELVSVRVEELA